MGLHTNKFYSACMWSTIISLVILYIVPLMMYISEIKFIKHIMVACGIYQKMFI
ncbi:DUF5391 family protein [Priestia megaterium]|uniref:DUF5391 family protein n=1 Tax=Priestia megaterium TaxID=1404 RepID=UPI0039E868D7